MPDASIAEANAIAWHVDPAVSAFDLRDRKCIMATTAK